MARYNGGVQADMGAYLLYKAVRADLIVWIPGMGVPGSLVYRVLSKLMLDLSVHTHRETHARTHARTHTRMHTHARTHSHTRTHARTRRGTRAARTRRHDGNGPEPPERARPLRRREDAREGVRPALGAARLDAAAGRLKVLRVGNAHWDPLA